MYEYHEEQERVLYIGDNKDAKEKAAREREQEEQRLYYVAITRAKARLYLPLVPGQLGGKQWKGGYRRLNDRLSDLVNGLDGSGNKALFSIIPVHDRPSDNATDQVDRPARSPASWQPPDELLKSSDNSGEFAGYRHRHAGYEVSSYSRMKRAWSGELNPLERDEFRRESSRELIAVVSTEKELPGGTAAGLMLHEILEKIPFDVTANAKSLEIWRSKKPVAEVIDAAMDRNGIGPAHRGEVEAMVYHALTFNVTLDQGRSIPGLCGCDIQPARDGISFPVSRGFPPSAFGSDAWQIYDRRGFIKGFVDLVVEHDSRVYFGDWKSDVLPSYSSETLKRHIADHYDLQAKLYAMALVKALAIRSEEDYEKSFGGLFYVFLRSLRPRGTLAAEPGVYFDRPTWAQILSYERELRRFATSTSGGRSMKSSMVHCRLSEPPGRLSQAVISLPASVTPADSELALLDWLEQLREPLKTLYNLEDEISYIAWELARWQEGLALRERQALILLILSALIQLRQGSTRIALRVQTMVDRSGSNSSKGSSVASSRRQDLRLWLIRRRQSI